jgi:hypothetical protein
MASVFHWDGVAFGRIYWLCCSYRHDSTKMVCKMALYLNDNSIDESQSNLCDGHCYFEIGEKGSRDSNPQSRGTAHSIILSTGDFEKRF